MDLVWVSGRSESETHWASAGAGMEEDCGAVRRGDGENPLASVYEWERNLSLERDRGRRRALRREPESCVLWIRFLGALKLYFRGDPVNHHLF